MQAPFSYGQDYLAISTALALSEGRLTGQLGAEARARVRRSSEIVARIAQGPDTVYGINTGFGPLCTTRISAADTRQLQANLLMSHAVGLGEPISPELARLMLVLKAQALAQGYSGIREETLERILWHVEHDVVPVVPSQGSVGASGDLAPLSHLFLPLLGLGKVWYKGQVVPAGAALQQAGLTPLTLGAKEGLALINGTQFIAAHAAQLVRRLHNVLASADLTGALMLEGLQGSAKPFLPELHRVRPFVGSRHVAARVQHLLHGSEIVPAHLNCARVQDPYSLRCMPQVHGASRNAWLHLRQLVETEINSVTDNPIVVSDELTISGGNFHGQLLALPLDYATLAAAEVGNVADRRIYLSLEGDAPGVPKLLLRDTGLNSGFMIVQYAAAALVSENKSLCFPASADSIPTSLGQEDHVSMGSISGRKALQVTGNVEKILGIELLCAAQALDFGSPLRPGPILAALHGRVRELVPHVEHDQLFDGFMEETIGLVRRGELVALSREVAAREGVPLATEWERELEEY